MYSRFPLSMENIPRSTGFLCLSLKFGCILTALIDIVYSTLGLAACVAAYCELPQDLDLSLLLVMVSSISHGVSFVVSFILIFGIFKDSAHLMRPWILWTTFQTLAYVSMFAVMSTLQMMDHFSDASFYVYFIEFVVLAIRVYMLVVAASYYKELIEEQEDEDRVKQLLDKETWYQKV